VTTKKRTRAADKLRPIVGPAWARQELIAMRHACTVTITEQRVDLTMFGTALRRLRTDADLSLREVARRLDKSAPFISDCELGRRKLKLTDQIRFVEICRSNASGEGRPRAAGKEG
jgi:DNA-binding transcriptional regulator YiaG